MKIAFYAPMKPPTDPVPSGDRRLARLLIAALERGGATVTLASRYGTYDRGDAARQRRIQGIGERLAARLIARYRLRPDERPDLWFTYHLYHKAPDPIGPLVAAALGIPYVVAEASHAPKQAGGAWDVGYRAAEAAIRAADRIYGINPVDSACLRPLLKHPSVITDLPLFIDTAPFQADLARKRAARAALDAEFGLRPGGPLILTVAMMRADQKLASYQVLAEALAGLGTRPWQILIVGGGPAEAEVRRAMQPLGDRVRFAGLRQGAHLAETFAAADIFAWPAVKEAVGMVFLEASAAGLSVVAGRSGGIDTILEDGRTGLVVSAGDAAAMALALARLLDDPALARQLGEAAAVRARVVHDTDVAAAFLQRDLAEVIRGYHAR